jgi:hypothetical protein
MNPELASKFVQTATLIFDKVVTDGHINTENIIEIYNKVFGNSCDVKDPEFISIIIIENLKGNSLLVYSEEEKVFYMNKNKL